MMGSGPTVLRGFGEAVVHAPARGRDAKSTTLRPYPPRVRALIWIGCGLASWGGVAGLGWAAVTVVRALVS
jgi:hypothetical protein